MYVLKYKNLDSQTAVGIMYRTSNHITGTTITKGMNYGTQNSSEHIKVFGIEDLWAQYHQLTEGAYTNESKDIMTGT